MRNILLPLFIFFGGNHRLNASSKRVVALDIKGLLVKIAYLGDFSLAALTEKNMKAYKQIELERNVLKELLYNERLRKAERDAVDVMLFLGNQ